MFSAMQDQLASARNDVLDEAANCFPEFLTDYEITDCSTIVSMRATASTIKKIILLSKKVTP